MALLDVAKFVCCNIFQYVVVTALRSLDHFRVDHENMRTGEFGDERVKLSGGNIDLRNGYVQAFCLCFYDSIDFRKLIFRDANGISTDHTNEDTFEYFFKQCQNQNNGNEHKQEEKERNVARNSVDHHAGNHSIKYDTDRHPDIKVGC